MLAKEGCVSEVIGGERIRLQTDEELDAGRCRVARALVRLEEELDAGRDWAARARARLELEQAAGRCASAKRVWL